MPRQPSSFRLDTQRLMDRVEDRIDRCFDTMLIEIGKINFELRKINMGQEMQENRLADLEMQIIETREQLQKNKKQNEDTATAVAVTAVVASKAVAETAEKAPKKVWQTAWGRAVLVSTGFIAMVSAFNNVPKFIRVINEVAYNGWMWLLNHG